MTTLSDPASGAAPAAAQPDLTTRALLACGVCAGSVLTLAFVLASIVFSQSKLVELGRLFQRGALSVGLGWLSLQAIHLSRGYRRVPVRGATGSLPIGPAARYS